MDLTSGRPGPSVQDVLATDTNPAPKVMLSESPATNQAEADLSIERYFSKKWYDREVVNVWRKCWQLACRVEEIPNVGDHIVYEIVHDSLIVVRTGPDEIRAYINSCLHRLVERSIRNAWWRSPSKVRTVSTRCSRTRGPARASSS